MLSGRRRISVRTRNCVFCFDLMAALSLEQVLNRSHFRRGDDRFCINFCVVYDRTQFASFTLSPQRNTSRKCGYHSLPFVKSSIKVNLQSIRFCSVFVRFFTFLLLLEKVCAFSSAFCKSISLGTVLHIDKNFVQKFCV